MTSDYEHEVFISYKRDQDNLDWVRNTAHPFLEKLVREQCGGRVCIDETFRTGSRLSRVIHKKITRSKVLVAFLTKDYFDSTYCRNEMALMMDRQEREQVNAKGENYGLVIPIVLMDGKTFPHPFNSDSFHEDTLLLYDLNPYYLRCRTPDSPKYDEFIGKLMDLAKIIETSIERAPNWCAEWEELTGERHRLRLGSIPVPQENNPSLIISHDTQN